MQTQQQSREHKYSPEQWDEFINKVAEYHAPKNTQGISVGNYDGSCYSCLMCDVYGIIKNEDTIDEYSTQDCVACIPDKWMWRKHYRCLIHELCERADALIERLYRVGVFEEDL